MSIEVSLEKTQTLVEFFSRIDDKFKLRHVELMLAIFRHPTGEEVPALTQLELINRYNIKASTASRDIEYLGEGDGGLQLLCTQRLAQNRKINEIKLTEKGEVVKSQILQILTEQSEPIAA